ncbi:MAG: glycoside hydrolase family 16 protein [Desulfobacteraceae bacterium]|nr:glycoside hydrolase family 16 protein [Desulfobacteraceae bacterium]
MAFIFGGRMMRKKSILLVPTITALIWFALFMQFFQAKPALAEEESSISLDDFEAAPQGWRYVGGEEFPGAQGSLEWDAAAAHKGKSSLRLDADFSKGGAYVGIWKVLPDFKGQYLKEIRLWVKSKGVVNIGVRILDDTDQCHQKKRIPLAKTDKWQEVVLRVSDLVGEESWGGANDAKWHGPAKAFGLNIGTDSLAGGSKGTLWLDDATCTLSTGPSGTPTVLPCKLSQPSCRPGFGTYLTYRWDAVPMGRDFTVFVHFRGTDGRMAFQNDHSPPIATAVWSGRLEYEKTIVVPTTTPEGEYNIMLGIYNPKPGGGRQPLKVGDGIVAAENDPTAYRIGVLKVDAKAPVPKLPAPTLNLKGYHLTFDEDFKEPLSVSAWGPGTRWIAHTPYAGDFGDARFADPEEGFPFTVENGILRIEARKDGERWRAGLLSSIDPKGNGFAQKYGYFEMRAKLPKGLGTWPAFWLLGATSLRDKSITKIEIDVLEQYGVNPNVLWTNVHLWYPDKRHKADGRAYFVTGMTDDFHNYGVMVDSDFITFYYDGVELRRVITPKEAKVPLYLLVDLALGGGWPIDKTPNPSYMYVDYVRAYSK